MSVNDYQLEAVITQTPFLNRLQYQLILLCENICSEATSTARHSDRVRLASQILNNPATYLTTFAQAAIEQMNQSTTNIITANGVTNGDVDTTDAALGTIISSIFNDFLPQPS